MLKKTIGILFPMAFFVFIHCTNENAGFSRDNPLDPWGSNWSPIVVAMPDTNVAIYDTFSIYARASTGGDTSKTIKKYLWALDGVKYNDSTDTGRIKTVFTSAGIKTVLVKARDNDGIVSIKADTVKITVHLYAPVVTTAKPDSNVAVIDSFFIHATAMDTNGTIKKYLWALDGVNYKDSTDSGKIKTAFASAGIKTVLVKARDNDGIVSTKADTVLITVHLYAPVVVAMADTNVGVIDSFFIHATASDTNGTIKKYLWALDGVNYKDSTDSGKIKTAFASAGIKTVLVKARDNDGVVSTKADTVLITVHLYAPVVVAMADTNVGVIDSFSMHATGTDTNGTIKKYLWAFDGVNYKDSTDSGKVKTVFTNIGVKTVLVKVRDNDGILSAADTVKVTVHLYQPVVTKMPDTNVAVIDSFFIHAAGSDTNGIVVKYLWALDGVNYKDSTDSGKIKTAFASAGIKNVLVKVRDNDGIESPVDTVKVTVHLYAPVVTAMNDTNVGVIDSFIIHAAGTDTNGTIKKYLWALDSVHYNDSTDSGKIKVAFMTAGVRTVLVKVRDNDGIMSTPDTVKISVHTYAPVVAGMPDTNVGINDTFLIHAAGTDTNGTVMKYLWALDGVSYNDSTDSGHVKTVYASIGIKTVLVKVRDNDGIVSAVDTVKVTVKDSTPINISPANGDTMGISRPTFIWVPGFYADSFTLLLDTINVPVAVAAKDIKSTSFTPAMPLISGKTYYWQVIGLNTSGQKASGQVWQFYYAPGVVAMPDTNVAIYDSFFVHAKGLDSNEVIKKYLWALDGVNYNDSTDSGRVKTVFTSAGVKTVLVKVRDSIGIVSVKADTVLITVHIYAPVVVAMPDTTVGVSDSFFVHASGTDTNGTVVKYLWALNGVSYNDSTDTGQIKTAFTNTGVKTVLVKVRDNEGFESAADTVNVAVKDSTPVNISPAKGATITDSLPRFSWVPGFFADSFRVLLDTVNPPVAVAATVVKDSSFTATTPLISVTTYYWQVIGLTSSGKQAKGDVWQFNYSPANAVVPYTSDANTILLDHFDGSTSASINAFTVGSGCGAWPSATPSYSYSTGQSGLGQAITMNPPAGEPAGSASYLQYSTQDILCQPNGTIEFWVYPTAYGLSLADQGQYYNSCSGWTFRMGIDVTGHLTASDWDGSGDWGGGVTSSQVVPMNAWTHVAVTWGSAGVQLYTNGVLVGSNSSTYSPASGYGGYLMMQCGSNAGSSCMIDELRISNVQRTSFNVP